MEYVHRAAARAAHAKTESHRQLGPPPRRSDATADPPPLSPPLPSRQQLELAKRVITQDDSEWLQAGWESSLHTVAGLDVSFVAAGGSSSAAEEPSSREQQQQHSPPQPSAAALQPPHSTAAQASPLIAAHRQPATTATITKQRAVAALAALSFPQLEVQHVELVDVEVEVPYAPGFLGFREVPAFQELLRRCGAAGVHPQVGAVCVWMWVQAVCVCVCAVAGWVAAVGCSRRNDACSV